MDVIIRGTDVSEYEEIKERFLEVLDEAPENLELECNEFINSALSDGYKIKIKNVSHIPENFLIHLLNNSRGDSDDL